MRVCSLLGLLFLVKLGSAFSIKGTIYDDKHAKLSYVNIYIKGTTNGTSSNGVGLYQLDLPQGEYDIVYQHLGFKQHIEHVKLTGNIVLDVTLEQTQFEIGDVVINGKEDPAIAVIKKAIEKRKYFLSAVESYSCDAYVKGMQRILSAPDRILGQKINK